MTYRITIWVNRLRHDGLMDCGGGLSSARFASSALSSPRYRLALPHKMSCKNDWFSKVSVFFACRTHPLLPGRAVVDVPRGPSVAPYLLFGRVRGHPPPLGGGAGGQEGRGRLGEEAAEAGGRGGGRRRGGGRESLSDGRLVVVVVVVVPAESLLLDLPLALRLKDLFYTPYISFYHFLLLLCLAKCPYLFSPAGNPS